MKKLFAYIFTLLVASLSSYASHAESQRIRDIQTFEREVVGRQLERTINDVQVVVEPNGTLSGSAGIEKISGKWKFKDGYFCRSFLVGSVLGQEDCQTISFDENSVTFVRAKGRGDRLKYQFAK